MAKFHISKNGKPAPCNAKSGNCPLGGESEHYSTREEANKAIENNMASQQNVLQSANKGTKQKTKTPINVRFELNEISAKMREVSENGVGFIKLNEDDINMKAVRYSEEGEPHFKYNGKKYPYSAENHDEVAKQITADVRADREEDGDVPGAPHSDEPQYRTNRDFEGFKKPEYMEKEDEDNFEYLKMRIYSNGRKPEHYKTQMLPEVTEEGKIQFARDGYSDVELFGGREKEIKYNLTYEVGISSIKDEDGTQYVTVEAIDDTGSVVAEDEIKVKDLSPKTLEDSFNDMEDSYISSEDFRDRAFNDESPYDTLDYFER